MDTLEYLHTKAKEFDSTYSTNRDIVLAIRNFIIEHEQTIPIEKKRQPKTIIESRFTSPSDAFECGMTSCGAVATIAAEMLRYIGRKVNFIHGENLYSVDHAWISVFNEQNNIWEEFDITLPDVRVPLTHVKKIETQSWEDIREQIESDHLTIRERRIQKGIV